MKTLSQAGEMTMIQTPIERQLGVRLRNAPIGECLTFEQFVELARRGRRAPDYHRQMAHIVSCHECRCAYLQMRAILQAQRPSLMHWLNQLSAPRLPQWALATGFAGVVFAFAVWALYPRPANQPQIAANSPSSQRPQLAQKPTNPTPNTADKSSNPQGSVSPPQRPQLAQKPTNTQSKEGHADNTPRNHGGSGTLSPQPPTEPHGQDKSPDTTPPLQRELAQVGSALTQGAESMSRLLASLAQGGVTRSSRAAKGQQITVIQPTLSETTLLEETTLTLQWSPVAGASKYTVVVRDRDTGETLLEKELPEAQHQLQLGSLKSGGEYELILSAPRGEQATLKTTLVFRVMSESQRTDLRWARSNASRAPLLAALVLYQLERYREALDALERAQQRYPDDEQIQRALEHLRAQGR